MTSALFNKCLMAGLVGFSQAAMAGVTGLYNTGVDDLGHTLADNAVDAHYQLVGGSSYAGMPTEPFESTELNPLGGPFGVWLPDTGASSWIAPTPSTMAPEGESIYRTTFTIDGEVTAITGRLAFDDWVYARLNGVDLPDIGLTGHATNWASFELRDGLKPGANSLEFIVSNGGGPTGLRVEFAQAVPEPESVVLMAFGLAMVGVLARRRR